MNGTDEQTVRVQKAVDEFAHQMFGTPEGFGKKLAEFASTKLTINGELNRSDYDLFCYGVLSQIRKDMELTGLILTKFEAQYE